jgi:hypothetical protein
MSKERELLKECLSLLGSLRLEELRPHIKLHNEIENLLAQPEQEQNNKWWYGKGVEDTKYFLKREPLSDEKLKTIAVEEEFLLYCNEDEFIEIARAIEQQHGIGVDDVDKPKAWMVRDAVTGEINLEWYKPEEDEGKPLYLEQPPLKPLTKSTLKNITSCMEGLQQHFFIEGARWAEQYHGIGVDDE